MIGGIPMPALGGAAFQGASATNQAMIQDLLQKAMAQSKAHLADTTLKSRSLTKELVNEQIRTIAFSADRTIANAQSERLLNKLSAKFNLISSMQRSLG